MPTPDQLNTAIIGGASLAVAGLSFVYASKAQHATRDAEVAAAHTAEVTVDAEAYRRAQDLYEASIKTFMGQNDSLRAEIGDLSAAKATLARQAASLEQRVVLLERALRAADVPIPSEPE